MVWFVAFLLLTGTCPLAQAVRSNRQTTLRQPLVWAFLAWAAWIGVACNRALWLPTEERVAPYGALCLTGCTGIAVFGARRPGAGAWNFVVVGLLAVLLLPLLNRWGELRPEPAQELFLGVTLLVPLLNYIPTRLGPGVTLTAAGCTLEWARLVGWTEPLTMPWLGLALLACGPWAAWVGVARRRASDTELDRLWLAYRDRFGFVWGQRIREQFNRSAHHSGWPVVLRWQGLQTTAPHPSSDPAALLAILRAVLKRFTTEEGTLP
jgi:hypothetical protein